MMKRENESVKMLVLRPRSPGEPLDGRERGYSAQGLWNKDRHGAWLPLED